MGEELVLEGHKYKGRFLIEEYVRTSRERVDTEIGYYLRNRTHRHWEGEGLIKNKQTGKEQKFLILPDGCTESDLVILGNSKKKKTQDYKGIVDLALQSMYKAAKESDAIIPKIKPPPINLEELVEQSK